MSVRRRRPAPPAAPHRRSPPVQGAESADGTEAPSRRPGAGRRPGMIRGTAPRGPPGSGAAEEQGPRAAPARARSQTGHGSSGLPRLHTGPSRPDPGGRLTRPGGGTTAHCGPAPVRGAGTAGRPVVEAVLSHGAQRRSRGRRAARLVAHARRSRAPAPAPRRPTPRGLPAARVDGGAAGFPAPRPSRRRDSGGRGGRRPARHRPPPRSLPRRWRRRRGRAAPRVEAGPELDGGRSTAAETPSAT